MDARTRWRRAIIISLIVNVILLCGVGILFAGLFETEPVHQLIELELVSDYSNQQPIDSNQGQESGNTAATHMPVPQNITSFTPVPGPAVTALSVDEVSSNSIADNASGEAQASSSPISSSTSGSSTVRGGGAASNAGSGGILRPQILSQVQPIYPETARQAGITGTVLLKVQILENGRTGDVSVKQSSGNNLLDESAVIAVYKWRFTPAKEKNTGRAVECYTTVPVAFTLN